MRNPQQILLHSLFIAWKDLTEFRRNRIALIFSLIFPILLIGMFGLIFQDSASALNNVGVGILNEDTGEYGNQIVMLIGNVSTDSNAIRLIQVSSLDDAEDQILSADLKAAMIIPQNFSNSIQDQKKVVQVQFLLADPVM